jgi:tetratricopeptide (TPR) repeat protein
MVVVDVERFGDPARTNLNQLAIRDGLYKALIQAFGGSGIEWGNCVSEDRGDGALILIPPEIPKAYLVTSLPGMLAAAVSRHNAGCARPEQMRLRVALHAGEVYRDAHGVSGSAVNHAFRLAEAPALRSALAASSGVLAVIVSEWLFSEVVRHDPAAEPDAYRKVQVEVKETAAVGWIRTVEAGMTHGDLSQDDGLPLRDRTATGIRDSHRLVTEGLLRGGAVIDFPGSGMSLITANAAVDVRRPVPAQLPHDVMGFTGRELELAALQSLLAGQGTAAVVILAIDGTAGVGKTALAVHFAHRVAAEFPDGQLFVNLRGFDPDQPPLAPGDVLAGFVRALGADSSQAPSDLDERAALYRSLLSGRRVLIVLDNAASAGQVRPLLPGMVGCLAIVTSRNTLSGLSARDGARRLTLDLLPPGDAVSLISRIAGTERTAAHPAAVWRLAQLCGRLPLALRITADRAASHRHLSMTDLVDELALEHDRLDALAADEKTTRVRAVFSWSYQALEPGPARAFRLLSLHPGPEISTPAAAALLDAPIPATRQLLVILTAGHLLEETGRDRYQFHDLVRIYATECAEASEPESHRTAAIRRLLTWYMHTADAFGRILGPDNQHVRLNPPPPSCRPPSFATPRQAMEWAESEITSLITAVRQAASVGDDEIAWKLPATLTALFGFLHKPADLLSAFDTALAATRRLGDSDAEAWILINLADTCLFADRAADAIEPCQRALAICVETGDLHGQWTARHLEGISYLTLERFSEALDCLEQAFVTARHTSNLRAQGMSLIWLGAVHEHLGSSEAAINLSGKAAALLGKTGNKWQHAFTIQRLAEVCHRHGRIGDALSHYQQARTTFHEIGDRLAEAIVLMEFGQAQRDLGKAEAARQCWKASLSMFEDLGDTRAEQVRSQLRELGAHENNDMDNTSQISKNSA